MLQDLYMALRLCQRELRTGLHGFGVFLGCLFLGVLAISAVGSLAQALEQGLNQDAKAILGGDISVAVTSRDLSTEEHTFLTSLGTVSRTLSTRTMARTAKTHEENPQAILIELKGVDQHYPLYGHVQTDSGKNLQQLLFTEHSLPGALADAEFFQRLNCEIGNTIVIGNQSFRLQGVLTKEPDKSMEFFTLGPKVMVTTDAFQQTGLDQTGSLFRTNYLLQLTHEDAQDIAQNIRDQFPESGWRIRDYHHAAPGIRTMLERMNIDLTLVSLGALLVGGLGIAGGVRGYLGGRLKHMATMKCLGASIRVLFASYLLQILILGLVGTGAGMLCGAAVPVITSRFFVQTLSIELQAGLYAKPLMQAFLFGVLTTLAFALPPLFRAISTPPSGIFRGYIDQSMDRLPKAAIFPTTLIFILLLVMVFWFSGHALLSLWFFCGIIGAWLVFTAMTRGIRWLAGHAPRLPLPSLRIGMANIRRPASPGVSLVFALGFGLTALVAIIMVNANLSQTLRTELAQEAPALFLMDIRPDIVENFQTMVTATPGVSRLDLRPMVRGRIVHIKDTPVEKVVVAEDVEWAVRGDRGFSYAKDFPPGSTLVRGTWWDETYAGAPLISITSDLARGFGVDIGDTLTLNILGRNLTATIASIREVNWQTLAMQFAIILSPGVLDNAPQTWLGSVYGQNLDQTLFATINTHFPDIAIITVRDVLENAALIMGRAALTFQITAAMALIVGLLVLAGAFAADQRRRIYDSVIYKVCGATRGDIMVTLIAEFSLAGLATSLGSLVLGTIAAWGVVTRLLKMQFNPDFKIAILTVVSGIILALIVGLLGTWRTLGQKTAPFLRNE